MPVSRLRSVATTLPMVLVLFLLCVSSQPTQAVDREAATFKAASQGGTTLVVEAPRPVWTAVEALVSRYGVRITYEDPPYKYEGDLEDVTDKVSRNTEASPAIIKRRVIVPVGGALTVSVPSSGILDILTGLVQAHSALGIGGRFLVKQSGDVFHVVPVESRDREGNWSGRTPVLDALITLPIEDRTYEELLNAFCKAVSVAAHVRILPGTGTWNGGLTGTESETEYHLGADQESARSVLLRILDVVKADRGRLTWALLYDAGSTNDSYALNIIKVPDGTGPGGRQVVHGTSSQ